MSLFLCLNIVDSSTKNVLFSEPSNAMKCLLSEHGNDENVLLLE